jgi:hypothetical protein
VASRCQWHLQRVVANAISLSTNAIGLRTNSLFRKAKAPVVVVVALTDAVAVADAVDVDVALADAVAMSSRRGSPYRLELLKIQKEETEALGFAAARVYVCERMNGNVGKSLGLYLIGSVPALTRIAYYGKLNITDINSVPEEWKDYMISIPFSMMDKLGLLREKKKVYVAYPDFDTVQECRKSGVFGVFANHGNSRTINCEFEFVIVDGSLDIYIRTLREINGSLLKRVQCYISYGGDHGVDIDRLMATRALKVAQAVERGPVVVRKEITRQCKSCDEIYKPSEFFLHSNGICMSTFGKWRRFCFDIITLGCCRKRKNR